MAKIPEKVVVAWHAVPRRFAHTCEKLATCLVRPMGTPGVTAGLLAPPRNIILFVADGAGLDTVDAAPVLGLLAESHLPYEVDVLDRAHVVRSLEIIARRAFVGWTTTGHTAVDVNLYAYGPGSASLRGNMDNTRIGMHLFHAFDLVMGLVEAP